MRQIVTDNMKDTGLRLLKRGSAKGTAKETVGSVTLTMPDGTVYPQKETDAKIQEIVGLTKSQFMQIAMIAQGEFMTLLRAKSAGCSARSCMNRSARSSHAAGRSRGRRWTR